MCQCNPLEVGQPLSIEATVGISFDLPGIESAISTAAIATRGADGATLLILQSHLKKLCKLQRTVLASLNSDDE